MYRLFSLLVLCLFLSSPGWGQTSLNSFTDCHATPASATAVTDLKVRYAKTLCFDFDSGTSAGAETSAFTVTSTHAAICLNQDRGGTAGAALIDIQVCVGNDVVGDNSCLDSSLQLTLADPCKSVSGGGSRYRLQIPTTAAGTEDAQVAIKGY